MKNKKPIQHQQHGFIMPVLLFTITLIVTMMAFVGSLSLTTYNLASREAYKVNAQLAADAGLDVGIHEFNLDNTWTGTSSSDPHWSGVGDEINLLDTPSLRTTYETDILPGASDDRRIIAVIARSYSPSTSATPKITRRYEVDLQSVTSGYGPSSVVSGVGGLVLNNNAKITGGDVVVNGTIALGNNSQIGLSSTPTDNAVNVRVSHINCPNPPDSTYPRTCAAGENGEPITIGSNAKIYADVRATNQISGSSMFNPGLVPNQTFPPVILPDYDRQAHKDAVAVERAPSHTDISCGSNGTKTWPENVKITGNVNLGNNCTVTLSGNVWITGNLGFGNNAKMKIPNSVGINPPVIMVDGSNGVTFGNNATIQANNVKTGAYIISYWSADSSCSPECMNVTGVNLVNSQNVVKINLSNNGSAPGSILYARWSRVRVSNNGAVGALAGQSIELGNNAVINFTSSLPGSDNMIVTWVKRGYMRVFE